MSCDFLALAQPGVQKLSPYQPGKPVEELERELGIRGIVKLASNENPLPPSRRALAAIADAGAQLARYPDGSGFRLKNALAARLGVDVAQLTLGNGSNDVLELLARAYLGRDAECVFSAHAFAVYPLVTLATGATPVVVPARDWGHDLVAMAAAVTPRTRVMFVANPNNPTGTWITRADLEQLLDTVPGDVIVVLDEAYFEYVQEDDYPDGTTLLSAYPNLVVTRTFSKAWGLAALRIGYGISNPQIADALNRVRQPFNANALALAAAEAVLDDHEFLEQSIRVNREGLQQLQAGCRELGLDWVPTAGNFLAVHVGREGVPLYQQLLHEGVIVRPVANYGMPDHLRVTVGTESENRRFLQALQKVLSA